MDIKAPSGTGQAVFADGADAGRLLAAELGQWAGRDVVVAGLPRGGVPVADQVARALKAPLDVIVVRKLGVPRQPELAMGAIAEGRVRYVDTGLVRRLGIRPSALAAVEQHERIELAQRVLMCRGDRAPSTMDGRVVVVVDDGIATGATAHVACMAARARAAQWIVVATPVGRRKPSMRCAPSRTR